MDKIKDQASKVGQLVFAAETGEAYRQTLLLTWKILRETALLIWLIICLVFVGAEWFWNTAIALGQKARAAYTGLTQQSSEEQSFESISKSLLITGENSAAFLLYQAKQQLGIKADPPEPKTVTPTPAPKPSTAPEAPKPSMPPVPKSVTASEALPSVEQLPPPVEEPPADPEA
jgi:hypothetical protein